MACRVLSAFVIVPEDEALAGERAMIAAKTNPAPRGAAPASLLDRPFLVDEQRLAAAEYDASMYWTGMVSCDSAR
jgi:hypothetical protein